MTIKEQIKKWVRKWLGIDTACHKIEALEKLLLHEESYHNGYATLKPHLQDPKNPVMFMGKPLK